AHREGGSMSRTAEAVRSGRGERVPPHHLEAEESVLGAMMFSPEAIASVVEHVKPGDFYRPAHQRLFEVMLVLYGRGEPVDAISVVEELSRRDLLEDIGGRLYVHNLLESVPLPAAAGHHARIVADHALLRRLIEASAQIMADAYAIPEDPRRAADRAESLIYQVARQDEKEQVVGMHALMDEALDAIEHIQQRSSPFAGVPTGFRDLDELLSGLQPGNLVVIAARPGVGKSSFVTNLARNVAMGEVTHGQARPVVMFSLEMSRFEIGMRLICAEARVPWDRVRGGLSGSEEWARTPAAAEALHDAP